MMFFFLRTRWAHGIGGNTQRSCYGCAQMELPVFIENAGNVGMGRSIAFLLTFYMLDILLAIFLVVYINDERWNAIYGHTDIRTNEGSRLTELLYFRDLYTIFSIISLYTLYVAFFCRFYCKY